MEFEEVFTVHVKTNEKPFELKSEYGDSVIMIPFTGRVTGKYFEGEVLPGGIDTQVIGRFGDRHTLSARYMLAGKDHTGEPCKIYIENNGFNISQKLKDVLFWTYPKIITNSKALYFLNTDILIGEGYPAEGGIEIKIFRQL